MGRLNGADNKLASGRRSIKLCIILADGRMFNAVTGRGVNCAGYVGLATGKHRAALASKNGDS